jgi:hypothetical protein
MQLSTTLRRNAALAALAAVTGSAALASAAPAATIGKPEVIRPGAAIPIDFPGYREPADGRLNAGYRIVAVEAEVARGEHVTTIVTAPKGFNLVTLGIQEGSEVVPQLADARRPYAGRRSVRLRIGVNPNLVAQGETGEGTIYALARRG